MIKVSIFYPRKEGGQFDMDYYLETHMPMSIERLCVHPGFRGVSVERGLDGAVPGTDATYVSMCHFCSTGWKTLWPHLLRMRASFRAISRTIRISSRSFSFPR